LLISRQNFVTIKITNQNLIAGSETKIHGDEVRVST
jgi:hypothetical protein